MVHRLQRPLLLFSGRTCNRRALVALDGVTFTALRIDGVAKLDQGGLALSGPFDRRSEQTIGAIGNRIWLPGQLTEALAG